MVPTWKHTDEIIDQSFPDYEGWLVQTDLDLGEIEVHYALQRQGDTTVLAMCMEGAYVYADDLQLACNIQAGYSEMTDGQPCKVLLIYGPLLIVPPPMPLNVNVLSLSEKQTLKHQTNHGICN